MVEQGSLVTKKSRRMLILVLAIALLFASYKFYNAYKLASEINDYISDEIWYVPSAKLIDLNVLNLNVNYVINGSYLGYNLFFNSQSQLYECRNLLLSSGALILRENYVKNIAIAIAVPINETYLLKTCGADKIIPGFPLPDNEGVTQYLNPEHPPLGKYVIGISIFILGDYPLAWRIPGLIEGFLIVLISALVAWKFAGIGGAVLASAAAGLDPLTTNMSATAMLDIHLAFFTALAILFYVYDRDFESLVAFSLATMVKYSGLFLLPFWILYTTKKGWKLHHSIIVATAIQLAVSGLIFMPLINSFGLSWVWQQFVSALKWHTQSRPPGPPSGFPLTWLLGENIFYLYYNPDMPAYGNVAVYSVSFVVALVLVTILICKELQDLRLPTRMMSRLFSFRVSCLNRFNSNLSEKRKWGKSLGIAVMIVMFFMFYIILYVIGNRTLYSFYLTQIAPAIYAFFPIAVLSILDLIRNVIATRISYIKTQITKFRCVS